MPQHFHHCQFFAFIYNTAHSCQKSQTINSLEASSIPFACAFNLYIVVFYSCGRTDMPGNDFSHVSVHRDKEKSTMMQNKTIQKFNLMLLRYKKCGSSNKSVKKKVRRFVFTWRRTDIWKVLLSTVTECLYYFRPPHLGH